jgi:hypothetical protein
MKPKTKIGQLRKWSVVSIACCLLSAGCFAQNVGINQSGTTPAASSILDLNSGNTFTSPGGKGLLPPNVSLTSVNDVTTVTSPATSLLVYNTATAGASPNNVVPGFYYFNGTLWVKLQTSASATQDWNLSGNAGTTGANFIGTTDARDLVLKTNSTENLRLSNSTGYVGINTAAPAARLDIENGATNGAIKIVDGTQGLNKFLMSDASGVGTWQSLQSINGVIVGNAQPASTVALTAGSVVYTGCSIVLPVGIWVVNLGFLVGNTSLQPNAYYFSRFTLSSSNASIATTNFSFLAGRIVSGPSATGTIAPVYQSFACGSFVVNVTAAQTFYIMSDNPLCVGTGTTANDMHLALQAENYLYAVPSN